MKVLFISSGTQGKIGQVVKNQGDSLTKNGIQIDFFLISEKGVKGYIKSIPKIRRVYREGKYDVVHAHYFLSAISASCAGYFPLVVSLMGSDAYMSWFWRCLIKILYHLRWQKTIVKTQKMQQMLQLRNAFIIPNGVDIEKFTPISKAEAQKKIGFDSSKKLIIFVSNPNRYEKNFPLALKSVQLLNRKDVELKTINNISDDIIPFFINAADLLLLTSKWEGSPNVIKEAMACNTPIVSSDVGDVKENLADVSSCFVCKSEASELAKKIEEALQTNSRTNGREKLISMGLDSNTVANKIIDVYNQVIKKNEASSK